MSRGIIEKALSGFYYVNTGTRMVACRARGRFRKEKISPLVGDWVQVQELSDGSGSVEAIEPRKCAFLRPAVANIDQLVVIVSQAVPVSDPYLIDRVCAIAELKGCGVVICINKCDLESGESLEELYCRVGYPTVQVSAETGEGMEKLYELISGKLSAFTGNSGVGKSSILNRLHPSLGIETRAVSEKLGRGRHTTRHVELYAFGDGYIADTPGFSAVELERYEVIRKEELAGCFSEFAQYSKACKFTGCSHTVEKGCAVLEAVRAGLVHPSRHASYCVMYEDAKKIKEWELKDHA